MVPVLVVNCWVAPRVTLALTGEMVVGALSMMVTTALAMPPGPVAVTVAVPDEGATAGAL